MVLQKLIFAHPANMENLTNSIFFASKTHTSSILELIHADVWGPSPVLSIKGYRYYLSFVDDFTRLTWIFPMKLKSEEKRCLSNFKCLLRDN